MAMVWLGILKNGLRFRSLRGFGKTGWRKYPSSDWPGMALSACPQNLWISLWESWVNQPKTCAG
jgi:hypothetical protein